ncbi:glycosyltransferase family 2 protein [Candidatus Parcubacteria bacterium]|jgi:dolichyl-phosphate beta-glucosyltransferase|nr:glycosyltransferase family 2 protein [Candidatus Parcubacteria bacterium]
MQISVIIPAYNEEGVIADTIKEIRGFLQDNFESFEIVVVDDKSTDSTLNIIQSLADVRAVKNIKNHGKGYSVAKGVKVAKGDLILFMDADNSTRIVELQKFLPQIKDYPIVIGSRGLKDSDVQIKQNFIKAFLGKAGNMLIRILVAPRISDTQCGFKLFTKESKYLFDKLTIERWGFDFELIFLARKYSLKIKEVPVVWRNNFDSKVTWLGYVSTLLQVFKVRLNNILGKYN